MKNPSEMTKLQVLKWLEKTAKSISNRPASCTLNSARGQDLVDRYEELRDEAMVRGDLWKVWCKYDNSDTSHDGYDRFA